MYPMLRTPLIARRMSAVFTRSPRLGKRRIPMNLRALLVPLLVLAPALARAQTTPAGPLAPAVPPPAAEIAVSGDVLHPSSFAVLALEKLAPPETIHAELKGEAHDWTGIRLSVLLTAAGLKADADVKHPEARFVVLARGLDGYFAAFSYAELLPEAENEPAYLAWAEDGKPLSAKEGPFRLVVPGEKPVRWVYNLGSIEIYDAARLRPAP